MKAIAIIPARRGSKGLPGKNVRAMAGRPLIEWTIDAAIRSHTITDVLITTNDPAIYELSAKFPSVTLLKRPEELASDSASSLVVVEHVLSQVTGFDCFVLLQPTSPLRNEEDIDKAFDLMLETKSSSCVSISEASESPWLMYQQSNEKVLSPILPRKTSPSRRQDLPQVYMPNGSIYICRVHHFLKARAFISSGTVGYEMPKNRSIDIDNLDDFRRCEQLILDCLP